MFKAIRDRFKPPQAMIPAGKSQTPKPGGTPSNPPDDRIARNAKIISLVGTLAAIFTASFYLYLALQYRVWQLYALSGDVWVLVLSLLVSYILVVNRRINPGIWLLVIAATISFTVGALLVSGTGLVLGISLAILLILVASQTLSGTMAERVIFIGVVFGVITILLDEFGLNYRYPAPQLLIFGLSSALIVAILAFSINFFRQFQQFNIATRLATAVFLISLPLVAGVVASVTAQARTLIEERTNLELRDDTQLVESTLSTWLEMNGNAVTQLATLPDITSMDPVRQKPVLEDTLKAYPNLFLVHTADLTGMNVARSDSQNPIDYKDRHWFQGAKSGAPITYEVLISRTTGKPALNIATPIKNASGQIIGVASIVSQLDTISKVVGATTLGQTGSVYVVDSNNQLVAHPDPTLTSGTSLMNYSTYPPVAALRSGSSGIFDFTDSKGVPYRAYLYPMDNGWAVIGQETNAELLAPINSFQRIAVVIAIAGLAFLLILTWVAMHRTLRPIEALTETVQAITGGDLNREAKVTSEDEIGTLAIAFNQMTIQVRNLIGTLEERVAERSRLLERRANQIRAAAEVGSTAVSVRDLSTLLSETVRLLSERFGFYHAGIFLLDENGKYAVLKAANSDGGQRMLHAGHKLEVGRVGIVGNVAATGRPRIALDVGQDAVFFDNPDLPGTRSEMALPIKYTGTILGVLDLQSTEAQAFTQEDIDTLQIVADQLAVALDNARLLTESQEAVETMRQAFGELSVRAWKQILSTQQGMGFRTTERGTTAVINVIPQSLESRQALEDKRIHLSDDGQVLGVPILIRGESIGLMRLVKPGNLHWTESEMGAIQALADQVSNALDTARLYNESQKRAVKEFTIGQISTKISATPDVETIMRVAVQELGKIIPGSEVTLQLKPTAGNGNSHEQA